MRIVHIDTGPEMRGGQHQVLLLLRGLEERGYRQVLLAKERSPLWGEAKAAGYQVRPATVSELWRPSRSEGVIVHAHDARAHTLAALVPGIRLLVSRRVAFPLKKSLLSKWKYGRAARYLAVSGFVRDVLRGDGISPEKIDVVYDGVETDLGEAARWNPEFPVVALASEDPGKCRNLMAQAAALANTPVVYSRYLPSDLQQASMFVYLTRSEGLGSAALLAMSMGVPVIASRVGGLAEVFIHSESGLYVRNDAQEIAGSIRLLQNDPQLAQHLIAGGHRRVQERFTAKQMVDNTLRVYERALAG